MAIAIVGAGLLGRLLAWQLLEAGHSVTLFDRDHGGGELSAGYVAAAMLAPLSEVLDAEPVVYRQGLAGIAVWRQWLARLSAGSGVAVDFRANGSIVVAHRNDRGDYQQLLQRLQAQQDINHGSISQLDKAGLAALEPELAERFDHGCFLRSEGCLDNLALYQALATRIDQLGGQRITRQVEQPAALEGFAGVVDCRGFAAGAAVSGLRGVRGEVIRVNAPEVSLSRPVRLVHPRYKLYIAPRPGHQYVIGATQIESSSEQAITVRSSLELLSALYSVHTGFAEAHIVSQQARCRPAFADNLPQIRRQGRVLQVNGLYRHGYLLAPAVVSQALYELGAGGENCWPAIVCHEDVIARDVS